jgi:hypothetical protein
MGAMSLVAVLAKTLPETERKVTVPRIWARHVSQPE